MGLRNDETYILYGGNVQLDYNDDKHRYTRGGKIVPSTTQITKAGINKEFLLYWSSKSASVYISKQWKPDVVYDQDVIDNILKRSINHFKSIQTRAADIGTEAHLWIESFVNYVLETGDKNPDIEQFGTPSSIEAINSVAAFLTWYDNTDVEFVASEKKVYSVVHNYSGTFDLLAIVEGVLTIVDFKTSKDIYEDNFIQGSAYVEAYEEEQQAIYALDGEDIPEDKLVQQFMVLHVPKDGRNYKTGIIERDLFSAYHQVFQGCRVVYDWSEKLPDNPWGDGSRVKPKIQKGKGKPSIFFPEYQS